MAQGGRIYITDRSSTPDDSGDTTGTGHYDTLLSLIPGGRRVQLGTPHGDVICPWDVPDPGHVPDQKIEFLLALHALLIGDAKDPAGAIRTLSADEETLLRQSIASVYRDCAGTRARPREQRLIDVLRARRGTASSAAAAPTGCSRCCCASSRSVSTERSPTSPTAPPASLRTPRSSCLTSPACQIVWRPRSPWPSPTTSNGRCIACGAGGSRATWTATARGPGAPS